MQPIQRKPPSAASAASRGRSWTRPACPPAACTKSSRSASAGWSARSSASRRPRHHPGLREHLRPQARRAGLPDRRPALACASGPGLIGNIYDGIQRPLQRHRGSVRRYIPRGEKMAPLDLAQDLALHPCREGRARRSPPGSIIGTVPETPLIEHRVMVPPNVSGKRQRIAPAGDYTVDADDLHRRRPRTATWS